MIILYIPEIPAQSVFTSVLDSVVVNIGRQKSQVEVQPYSLTLIDSIGINRTNNRLSLREVMGKVPGVTVNNRYNIAQGDRIVIRGIGSRAQFGVRGIKLLLNDIPLTFPDGQSQLNNLNISSVGNIEIIRGPSSALYGNSSGGVISISTKRFESGNWSVIPEFNYGSLGFYKYDLSASGKILNGSAFLNLHAVDFAGYREHSESKYYGGNFIVKQNIDQDIRITGVINYFNAPYLLNPSSLNKADAENNPKKAREFIIRNGAGKEANQLQGGITLDYKISQSSELKATVYGISRELFNAIPNRIIELDRASYGVRSTFLYKPEIFGRKLSVLSGVDYEFQDDNRIEFENDGLDDLSTPPDQIFERLKYGDLIFEQTEKVWGIGVFSQLNFAADEQLSLTAGLRYDDYKFEVDSPNDAVDDSRRMDNISPFIGGTFDIIDWFTLFANYSTGFQTPTTTELSNNPNGVSGFNNQLKPEQIRSFEIGLRNINSRQNFNYEFVFYHMVIDDMLIPYQNEFEETYYQNSGETESNGIEVRLNYSPFHNTWLDLAYAYQDIKFTDFVVENDSEQLQLAGKRVPGIPEHSLNVNLGYEFLSNLFANFGLTTHSKIFTTDYNEPLPGSEDSKREFISDGYTLIDISLVYQLKMNFGRLAINAGVENIFDVRYNASIIPNAFGKNFFEPAPGRLFYFGTRISI